ncbi:MAG: hypothetical protein D6798_01700, partial [Deltaproteobacteria bacterium]
AARPPCKVYKLYDYEGGGGGPGAAAEARAALADLPGRALVDPVWSLLAGCRLTSIGLRLGEPSSTGTHPEAGTDLPTGVVSASVYWCMERGAAAALR